MRHKFTPSGVCSDEIQFDIENGKLGNVVFTGGCDGNLQAISKLTDGMDAKEVVAIFKGIDCDGRGTSCPDQFAIAIEEAL